VAVSNERELRTCGLALDKVRRNRFEEDKICSMILVWYLGEALCGLPCHVLLVDHLSQAEEDRIETKIERKQSLIDLVLESEIGCLEFRREDMVIDTPRESVLFSRII